MFLTIPRPADLGIGPLAGAGWPLLSGLRVSTQLPSVPDDYLFTSDHDCDHDTPRFRRRYI